MRTHRYHSRQPWLTNPVNLYRPHPFLRSGNLQTIISRRLPPGAALVNREQQMVLFDAGPDHSTFDPDRAVRLLGFYTPALETSRAPSHTPSLSKGLAMLLHGWEGDSHSAYNLVLGSALVRAGYDVMRLNLRDHGPTHHLNRGIFFATLIEEVHAVTQRVGLLAAGKPFFLIGASLGGSFAVRMALLHARRPIPNLRRAIAINPVLNPRRTCILLDNHPLLRRYFRRRWLDSLRKKQELFPELYDFTPLRSIQTIWDMTDCLTKNGAHFNGVEEYLNAYSVKPRQIHDLNTTLTILSAANDPIIPPCDIAALPPHPLLQVHILPYGGHVGYNDLFPLRNRLPELIETLLDQEPITD